MKKTYKAAVIVALSTVLFVPVSFAQDKTDTAIVSPPKREIIVVVSGGRVRSEPSTAGSVLKESTLGTRFFAISERNGWDEVILEISADDSKTKTGWISKTITESFDFKNPGVQFQKIANKYLGRKSLSFNEAKQLYEVLPAFADDAKTYEVGGDLRLKSLTALSLALKAIPFDKGSQSPYKEFLTKHKNDVVYSEPAGEWYVRSDRYWELHQRYRRHKIGESIAWSAAATPLPGECEGYINCYLYNLRATDGEYLNFYPNGKFTRQALQNINAMLQPIAADAKSKSSYYTTSDISDRAEFNRMLADLRKIVSRTPFVEKQDILRQIDLIAEAFR